MRKIMQIKLPWHLIWIMTLLEGITVPLLVWSGKGIAHISELKLPLHGFLVGAVGTFILFLIINRLVKYLSIKINNQKIISIQPLEIITLWGGVILWLLFLCQNILHTWLTGFTNFSSDILLGFIPTFVSMLMLITLYNEMPYTKLRIISMKQTYIVKKLSVFSSALLISLYEAIALPIIWFTYQHTASALLSGLLGGLIGAVAVYLCYRYMFKVLVIVETA